VVEDQQSFEEVVESKEMIEEKVNRRKYKLVDLTLAQRDIAHNIEKLEGENDILKERIKDCMAQQQQASDREDYDEAEMLAMRMGQTERLVESKLQSIQKLHDDSNALELKKAEKYKDLATLIRTSFEKLTEIQQKQKEEKQQFEETETQAIETRRKTLKFEGIRVDVTRKELASEMEKSEAQLKEIEDKVKEETRDTQVLKGKKQIQVAEVE
jgi:hypothetical protein